MRTHKLLRQIRPYGPRGTAMLALAAVALLRAREYLAPSARTQIPIVIDQISSVVPLFLWGLLWGATGMFVLFAAFRMRQALALGILAGMSILWAGAYVVTAVMVFPAEGFSRAALAALTYSAMYIVVQSMARMINPPVRIPGGSSD